MYWKMTVRTSSVFSLAIFVSSCSLCENELVREISSPDSKFVVSIFERNCGATTPYITIVSLRSSEESFDPESSKNWIFTIHEKAQVEISWLTDSELAISHTGMADIPRRMEKWKHIDISYAIGE